jgi:hypothetical protein
MIFLPHDIKHGPLLPHNFLFAPTLLLSLPSLSFIASFALMVNLSFSSFHLQVFT